MYENDTTQEINLLDMVSAVLKKWRLLICVTLAALVAGGVFGFVMAVFSNNAYGTKAEFFVSSDASNGYILSLMKSDTYAEWLLMDENNLPEEYKGTEIYEEAKQVQDRIFDLEENLIDEAEDALFHYEYELSQLSKKVSDAQSEYSEVLALLEMYKKADGEALKQGDADATKNHFEILQQYEEEFEIKKAVKEEAKAAYNAKLAEQQADKNKLNMLNEELSNLKQKRTKLFEKIHVKYVANPDNAEKIEKLKEYITCGFTEETADVEKLASKAVIYISIAVPYNEEYAEDILKRVAEKTEDFVEINESSAECEYLNSFTTTERIEVYPYLTTPIKYGIVAAIAALAVTCVIIAVMPVFKTRKEETVEQLPEKTEE